MEDNFAEMQGPRRISVELGGIFDSIARLLQVLIENNRAEEIGVWGAWYTTSLALK